jgi:hypothetical protein
MYMLLIARSPRQVLAPAGEAFRCRRIADDQLEKV